jgi:hypothetical protein
VVVLGGEEFYAGPKILNPAGKRGDGGLLVERIGSR